MEEITKTAKTYYANLSKTDQLSAYQFFKTMDTNGDEKISSEEFARYFNSNFFTMLDIDNNGMLDFDEFITLQYLRISKRGLCDGCRKFPKGTYFTCVPCFENASGVTFDLCCDCYGNKIHHGHPHSEFLDNLALLNVMRKKNKDSEKDSGIVKYHSQSKGFQLAASGVGLAATGAQLTSNGVQIASGLLTVCTIM